MNPRALIAVLLIAAGFAGFWYAHKKGYEAGSAAVRAAWGQDRARAAEAATEALRASDAAYRAEVARRNEVERGLQAKLADSDRRGAALARRLRSQSCPLPAPSGSPAPVPDDPTGVPGDEGAIGEALAAHLAACERDATRLAELQAYQ